MGILDVFRTKTKDLTSQAGGGSGVEVEVGRGNLATTVKNKVGDHGQGAAEKAEKAEYRVWETSPTETTARLKPQ
jgi:hypothetical protein